MPESSENADMEARFERLVAEYGRFLRSVIARTCPRNLGIQIKDIEQEANLRMWRALRDERNLTNVASYIYRIAVTTTIDAVRRVMARHEEQLCLEEGDEPGAEMMKSRADPSQLPDRTAELSQLMQKVKAALARLGDNRRIAVEFYLQGMTSQEIADLCDWSEPKARNLIYRGLNDLRQHLREQGIDYES